MPRYVLDFAGVATGATAATPFGIRGRNAGQVNRLPQRKI